MQNRVFERTWIAGKAPKPDGLDDFAFQGEAYADTFIIDGQSESGTAVEITGAIRALYYSEHGLTIPIDGEIEDGKAVITLDDACYTIPGKFILSIFASNDDQTQCIYAGVGTMYRTQSDNIAYPSSTIPDIMELLQLLEEAIASVPQEYAELTAHFPITGEFVLGNTTITAQQLAILNNGVASLSDTKTFLGL